MLAVDGSMMDGARLLMEPLSLPTEVEAVPRRVPGPDTGLEGGVPPLRAYDAAYAFIDTDHLTATGFSSGLPTS